ncbi:MAG: ArsR family transcriptional regulator [Thermoplasmata archaeon]|uniref:ArsR family transcriptional regulator n=1 Tax=Candidatus Sysuiplasma superficiale TaxID=2823368 RepID=A0A8J7YHX1_9ARCH|nr:ArsR family transcriptional regulator [Candidatus Sysuiplasma superficiale]MBX8644068.1 ArsR family transcriptional regulator [Candidatus Sysuiplasma superficiale]MCL4346321.1 ArsR family transcriptional regulator [Candidatus Thermoplasmatota archaeon]MCL5437448.1 ArsR family transcriptional regulator [Candidatus Thermoplasmatota archaeon]
MEKDPLSLETRRRIFQFIRERPGSYPREIVRELSLQFGVVQYHLGVLVDLRILTFVDDGFRKRYYVSREVKSSDRQMLSVLKLDTPRRIVLHLFQKGEASFDEIRSQFGFSKSALSFHMKKLLSAGIVGEKRSSSRSTYYIVDRDAVARILITYRSSFLDNLVDSFIDSWLRL